MINPKRRYTIAKMKKPPAITIRGPILSLIIPAGKENTTYARLNITYAKTVRVTDKPRFCARKIKKASELFPIAKIILRVC